MDEPVPRRYGPHVLAVIRLALQVVLFFMLLSVVVGFASAETGVVEKVALVALAGVLVWFASRVRQIGAGSPHHSV